MTKLEKIVIDMEEYCKNDEEGCKDCPFTIICDNSDASGSIVGVINSLNSEVV